MINHVMTTLKSTFGDNKGISALEYGILAAAIITAVASGVGLLSTEIGSMFNAVILDLKNVAG
jgi:Flp pilus assembly pilin Flp